MEDKRFEMKVERRRFVGRVGVILLFFIFYLSSSAILAQGTLTDSEAKARALLSAMAMAQQQVRRYSAVVVIKGTNPPQSRRVKVIFERPNRVYATVTAPEKSERFVADGEALYFDSSANPNTYTRDARGTRAGIQPVLLSVLPPESASLLAGRELSVNPSPGLSLNLLPEERVNGVLCTIVAVDGGRGNGSRQTIRFAIGTKDKLIRQVRETFYLAPNVSPRTRTTDFLEVQVNPKLGESTFKYTPPKGAKLSKIGGG